MKGYIGPRDRSEEVVSEMTITLTSSMTAAQMQTMIDQIPRYLSANVTIQFSDGTYALDNTLFIHSFRGDGTLYVQGNAGESGRHTNQAVVMDFGARDGLSFYGCTCPVVVTNIRINTTAAATYYLMVFRFCSGVEVYGCCFDGSNTAYSVGCLVLFASVIEFYNNTVGALYNMMYSSWGSVCSAHDNAEISSSDKPAWGYICQRSATLGYYGTTPAFVTGLSSVNTAGRTWT